MRLPDTIAVIRSGAGGSVSKLVVVRLYQSKQFQGMPIGVEIDFGSGPNTMQEIPGEYIFSDSDLKVHLASGETVTYGDRVNVSGTVYFPTALADTSTSRAD